MWDIASMKVIEQTELETFRRALVCAANELYVDAVMLRGAESALVGPDREFKSRADWIDDKIKQWMTGAETERKPPVFGVGTTVRVVRPNEPERRGRIESETQDGRGYVIEFPDAFDMVDKIHVYPV
jgi:hypothetical protein